jgi:hypothetical protein
MYIELKSNGCNFLTDFESGWEIWDKGIEPAGWVNHKLAMNQYCDDTYAVIRKNLIASGLLIDEGKVIDRNKLLAEFAKAALPAVIAWNDDRICVDKTIANTTFIIAEAMLAEYEKRTGVRCEN